MFVNLVLDLCVNVFHSKLNILEIRLEMAGTIHQLVLPVEY